MSVNGYICIEITTDAKYEKEARRWAKEHFYRVSAKRDGKLIIDGDGDVSYFDTALEHFAHEVSELAIPASEWKAEVHYTCEEGACDNGGNIHVEIADGRIVSFQESRIEMVEVEPWCTFEMTEEKEEEIINETGYRCPKCGQTEEFDAISVVLDGRTHITADGWNFWDYANDVDLHPSSLMECCKCHHVQHQAFFMEEE